MVLPHLKFHLDSSDRPTLSALSDSRFQSRLLQVRLGNFIRLAPHKNIGSSRGTVPRSTGLCRLSGSLSSLGRRSCPAGSPGAPPPPARAGVGTLLCDSAAECRCLCNSLAAAPAVRVGQRRTRSRPAMKGPAAPTQPAAKGQGPRANGQLRARPTIATRQCEHPRDLGTHTHMSHPFGPWDTRRSPNRPLGQRVLLTSCSNESSNPISSSLAHPLTFDPTRKCAHRALSAPRGISSPKWNLRCSDSFGPFSRRPNGWSDCVAVRLRLCWGVSVGLVLGGGAPESEDKGYD